MFRISLVAAFTTLSVLALPAYGRDMSRPAVQPDQPSALWLYCTAATVPADALACLGEMVALQAAMSMPPAAVRHGACPMRRRPVEDLAQLPPTS